MKTYFDSSQSQHDPQFFLVRGKPRQSAEQPERVQRFLSALESLGLNPAAPEDFGPEGRALVHTPAYLDFLTTAYEQWHALPDASEEVVANIFANRYSGQYPSGIVGRAGWHMADTACPVGRHTWAAACASANTALSAAQSLLDDERQVYALCRPPGHHAFADMAGGFCFLNNAALAAEHLRQRYARVAILDVDVHHGNGTQGIFYRRKDVLTVSTHTDPTAFYPFHWGHACERGEGEGEGYNLNLPLRQGASGDELIAAVASAGDQIKAFAPGALIVALGLDTSEEDPLQGMTVKTAEFTALAKAITELDLPTVYVQEGGYLSSSLGDNLAAFLHGLM
ncbi:MAG: histone deacetylase family protein [Gammaproteobacteria bacterium]|nr:histone deacetylase family protein [Gammaproteobacteria bacterium]